MKLWFEHRGQRYQADGDTGISLALPLDFAGSQPSFYGVEPATARALEAGGFVGDTERGGSCNVESLELIPHCHGTHTESIAHLSHAFTEPPRPPAWMAARVVSVMTHACKQTGETYPPPGQADEAVISRADLSAVDIDTPALIVRTRPNDPAKRQRQYQGDNPHPYFTLEAIDWLLHRGVDHLLVDTPSIDRGRDDGSLPAHRRFWALDADRQPTQETVAERTVTEFVFVPDEVPDGLYLLNLQLPDWCTDAVPSRPVVFSLALAASIREEGD